MQFSILTRDEVEAIHQASLDILDQAGVEMAGIERDDIFEGAHPRSDRLHELVQSRLAIEPRRDIAVPSSPTTGLLG